jgi:hypothetical protein
VSPSVDGVVVDAVDGVPALLVVPGVRDEGRGPALGTNSGVGFEESPNPLPFRAFTFAVYATPPGRP